MENQSMYKRGKEQVEFRSGKWSAGIHGFLVAAWIGATFIGCGGATSSSHSEEPRSDDSEEEEEAPRPSRSSRSHSSRSSRSSRSSGSSSRESASSHESGESDASGGKGGSVVGRPLPDMRLTALNGKKGVRLGDYRGKVVLLDVWASWCAPCKTELPMLDDMAGRLKSKGIEIVAVSVDDNREDAEEFLRSRRKWSIKLAHDPDGKLPGKLQPPKMPSSYIVDRDGVIRHMNAGFENGDVEKLESRLVKLAAEG
jgi:thiol-disulfide isomerase/thioredoxin